MADTPTTPASYEHFEIVEYVDISEKAAQELSDELTGLSLIEDRTYGGLMIVRHHEGGSDD